MHPTLTPIYKTGTGKPWFSIDKLDPGIWTWWSLLCYPPFANTICICTNKNIKYINILQSTKERHAYTTFNWAEFKYIIEFEYYNKNKWVFDQSGENTWVVSVSEITLHKYNECVLQPRLIKHELVLVFVTY